jgi:hypothetical protein
MSDGMGHFHCFCNPCFEVSHPSRNGKDAARVGHPALKDRVG